VLTRSSAPLHPRLPACLPTLATYPPLQSQEPSPELLERLAVEEGVGDEPPEGFYPRSKSVSPVQRKIREMEVGAGAMGARGDGC
jgi:hypothetical protein